MNHASPIPPFPIVADHQLIRCIGLGSYGEVWLASSLLGAYRAVKIVRRCSFDSSRPYEREINGLRRFEPLSRLGGGLVPILHVGQDSTANSLYSVMELADPEEPCLTESTNFVSRYQPRTLSSDLGSQIPLPLNVCIEIGLSVAEGLLRLHSAGLVHRDVKPSNILFVGGRACLADTGLVDAWGKESPHLGTLGYLPPEGSGLPQADLYGLGKVLYQIATGLDLARFPEMPMQWTVLGHQAHWTFHQTLLRLGSVDPRRRQGGCIELCAELRPVLNSLRSQPTDGRRRRWRDCLWRCLKAPLAHRARRAYGG